MSNHANEIMMERYLDEAIDLSIPQLLSALSDSTRDQLMEDIKEVSSIVTQRQLLETAFVNERLENTGY